MKIETASGHTILADDEDYDLLFEYTHTWWIHNAKRRPYAAARLLGSGYPGKRIFMHRLIMKPPPGMVVHHINNDGLDNRRCNLEVTTTRQNLRYHHDTFGGAYFDKSCGKWRSALRDNDGKLVSLGLFEQEAEALEAAKEFRLKRQADGLQRAMNDVQ